jgi:RNA polymerase sigma factor (sigma-70 family)
MAQVIARSMRKRLPWLAVSLEDFEQMAAIGLLAAIRRYDPEGNRNVQFPRYASIVIVRSILDQLRESGVVARRGSHGWGVVLMPLDEDLRFAYLPAILDELIACETIERLHGLDLTWRERFVLEALLDGKSQRDIAASLSVTEGRVSQLRAALLSKIRADLRSGPSLPLKAAA